MNDIEMRVLARLESARPHAVTKAMFRPLSPRRVEAAVRELRLAGHPIASDTDGYWIAVLPSELRDTADGLLRRMSHVAETRAALLETAERMELAGMGAETPGLWDEVRP